MLPIIGIFVGMIMINKTGRYENIWGAMFFGGIALTIALLVILLVLVAIFGIP